MKKRILIFSALSCIVMKSFAQVNDVSVIVVPMASYNKFDEKTTVEDGLMYGLQAGFGFGKVVELTGTWEKSANLKQSFGKYENDINRVFPDFQFTDRQVNVERYGGQIKFNIPAKGFAPYAILGTGILNYKTSFRNLEYKNENLYSMGGLGLKINMIMLLL
jgi:hypothetical protein